MTSLTARLAAAVAVATSVLLAVPAQAQAQPSCLSVVRDMPHGTVGPLISNLARQYQPLGPVIASEATSPHDACPPE